MKAAYEQSAEKPREIGEFAYAAQSWDIPRRVMTGLEYCARRVNPRFIVSHLPASDHSAEALYDGLYCQRGEAENQIKETQRDVLVRAPVASASKPISFACSWPHSPTP